MSPRYQPLTWREGARAAVLLAALVLLVNAPAFFGGELAPAAHARAVREKSREESPLSVFGEKGLKGEANPRQAVKSVR